jgi:hypothetical protein
MVKGLENWNVLATAKDMEQRRLAGLLRRFGNFRRTRFLGVLVGRVKEPEAFFEELRRHEEEEPGFLDPLSKLVPIDRTFGFAARACGGDSQSACGARTGRSPS